MRRKKMQPIADVLKEYLATVNLEQGLNETRLIEAWNEILGQTIRQYTTDLHIRNRKLYVHLTSPALRSELSLCRQRLIDRLNEHVGAEVITDIIFR